MKENIAPIIMFVYNRLDYLKSTIGSLKENSLAKESILYIFSDAPKDNNEIENVNHVRNYIKGINGFKDVIIINRDHNDDY